MGADWVKFRIQPSADIEEVRELAAFDNEHYPHGRWIVTPPGFVDDEATLERWRQCRNRLESLLIFPKGDLDYWSHTSLTDPPGMNLDVALGGQERDVPHLKDVDACRVYVISHNPVFPIEWRDAAYRTILPDQLRPCYDQWREYIEEVRAGSFERFLHELYLFDRLTDTFQLQEYENLVDYARVSLTRTNNWCRKDDLRPVRERILQFDALERLKGMRETMVRPALGHVSRVERLTTEQRQKEAAYEKLCQAAATQIREWNRLVPGKWKVQVPSTSTYSDFIALADGTWLKSFFAWCEALLDQGYGLFLWA